MEKTQRKISKLREMVNIDAPRGIKFTVLCDQIAEGSEFTSRQIYEAINKPYVNNPDLAKVRVIAKFFKWRSLTKAIDTVINHLNKEEV